MTTETMWMPGTEPKRKEMSELYLIGIRTIEIAGQPIRCRIWKTAANVLTAAKDVKTKQWYRGA